MFAESTADLIVVYAFNSHELTSFPKYLRVYEKYKLLLE